MSRASSLVQRPPPYNTGCTCQCTCVQPPHLHLVPRGREDSRSLESNFHTLTRGRQTLSTPPSVYSIECCEGASGNSRQLSRHCRDERAANFSVKSGAPATDLLDTVDSRFPERVAADWKKTQTCSVGECAIQPRSNPSVGEYKTGRSERAALSPVQLPHSHPAQCETHFGAILCAAQCCNGHPEREV